MSTPTAADYGFEQAQTLEELKTILARMRDDLLSGTVFPAQTGT